MKKAMVFFCGILVFSLLGSCEAEEILDVAGIVDKANKAAYYQADDGKANVHMTITDSQGRTRERAFTILRKDIEDGGDQLFYVYFSRPADVRKMVFMVLKKPGKDDDRWLYLPALDLVKRIAASDKRSSFVGSDFLYEDVSGRGVNEDDHELLDQDDKHYIVLNKPKDPDGVEFSSFKIWIDKQTFLPVKAEYYNKSDKLYRTVEALKMEEVGGYPTIVKSKVKNLETGSTTELSFSDIQYDIGLEENIFTERYLRRPPKEAKK